MHNIDVLWVVIFGIWFVIVVVPKLIVSGIFVIWLFFIAKLDINIKSLTIYVPKYESDATFHGWISYFNIKILREAIRKLLVRWHHQVLIKHNNVLPINFNNLHHLQTTKSAVYIRKFLIIHLLVIDCCHYLVILINAILTVTLYDIIWVIINEQ